MCKKQQKKKFKFVRNLVRHYNRRNPTNQLILHHMFYSRAVWITNNRGDLSRILYLDWSKDLLKTLFSTI